MGFLDRWRTRPDRDGVADSGVDPRADVTLDPGCEEIRLRSLNGGSTDEVRGLIRAALVSGGVSTERAAELTDGAPEAIGLHPAGDRQVRSRIAGPGLLPPNESWPLGPLGTPMSFIAAIDVAELPANGTLPADGWLLAFWDEMYFEYDRMDFAAATRLFHTAEVVEAQPPPSDVDAELVYATEPVAAGWQVGAIDLPYDHEVERADAATIFDALDALSPLWRHQLLGRSKDIQDAVLDEIAYWFEQGFDETRARYRPDELAGRGWRLLLQVDSTDDLIFGDMGTVYFVIPELDLAAGDVSRVMGIMQCT